jgi:hypothetical protein
VLLAMPGWSAPLWCSISPWSGAVATGEVHLETCIKDLRERFARVELTVSPPLVAFRESVADPAEAPDAVHRPPKVRLSNAKLL